MKKTKSSYTFLITAGPTREYIDPVRFISNPATGLIGYLIAALAQKRGHKVTLLSGPTHLKAPDKVARVNFTSTLDLKKIINKYRKKADCIISTAAVGDFRPARYLSRKIKKNTNFECLKLVKTPDILADLGKKKMAQQILIGFALETAHTVKNAKDKLKNKNLDFIVANNLNKKNYPFGKSNYDVKIIDMQECVELKHISKDKLARIILDRAEKLCYSLCDKK